MWWNCSRRRKRRRVSFEDRIRTWRFLLFGRQINRDRQYRHRQYREQRTKIEEKKNCSSRHWYERIVNGTSKASSTFYLQSMNSIETKAAFDFFRFGVVTTAEVCLYSSVVLITKESLLRCRWMVILFWWIHVANSHRTQFKLLFKFQFRLSIVDNRSTGLFLHKIFYAQSRNR